MSIGERITELRKQNQISQYQLAKMLGVSRQAVSKWENDQSSPDTINLIRLADLLNTQVEYLATGQLLSPSPAEKIVVVEKPVEVEKIVEVPKIVTIEKKVPVEKIVEIERIVEKPVVRKILRYKYLRNPLEFAAVGAICFILGLVIGILI